MPWTRRRVREPTRMLMGLGTSWCGWGGRRRAPASAGGGGPAGVRRQLVAELAAAAAAARLHLALVPAVDIVDRLQFGLVRLAEGGAEAGVHAQFVGGDVGEDVPVRPAGVRARPALSPVEGFLPGLVGDGVDGAEGIAGDGGGGVGG